MSHFRLLGLLKVNITQVEVLKVFFTRSATKTWCKLLEALPSLDHCAFPDLAEKDLSDDWLEWSRAPGMADE